MRIIRKLPLIELALAAILIYMIVLALMFAQTTFEKQSPGRPTPTTQTDK